MNICWAEISRDLEISSKCSVKAIKNTTLSKIRMVSKGFRPMGSNAQLFRPSLVPRHSLLPRCPNKVWQRVCASHFQWRHERSMFLRKRGHLGTRLTLFLPFPKMKRWKRLSCWMASLCTAAPLPSGKNQRMSPFSDVFLREAGGCTQAVGWLAFVGPS